MFLLTMLHKKSQKELVFAVLSFVCMSALAVLTIQANQLKEEFREENERLEENNSKLKDDLSNKITEVDELNDNVESLNDSLNKQVEQIEELKKNNKKLNNEIEKKEEEIEGLVQLSKKTKRNETKTSNSSGYTHTMEVTQYTAGVESTGKRPGDPAYGVTASGKQVQLGVTIACPPSIPFGTKIDIKGIGVRECMDRGSAITEGKLDVYVENLNDALSFGRQKRSVKILN